MRKTKITEFYLRELVLLVLMKENIGEFHITVNNALRMDIL